MASTNFSGLRMARFMLKLVRALGRRPAFQTVKKTGNKAITARLESDTATTSGIAMFTVIPTADITQHDVLVVSVRDAGVAPVHFNNLPHGSFQVGVHTHLLAGGDHYVDFSLLESGEEVFRGTIRLEVAHDGALAKTVAAVFRRNGTPFAFRGPCDASHYPYDADEARPWFDRNDADAHIDMQLRAGKIDELEAGMLRQFVRDGYLVVEGLIDHALIDRVNAEIDDAIARGHQGYKRGSSARMEHLHEHYPNIRSLWLDRRHLRLANLIFDGLARPCQTLVFVCGSQQDVHSDVIHLTPFPAGYMCGIWIALQDVVPDSGELVVYPGTHRRKRLYLRETGVPKVAGGDWTAFGKKVVPMHAEAAKDVEPFVYRPKKGTVLIWHENLMHGGSPRRNPDLERRSMVIHAFADGAVAYYDSTGSAGTVAARDLLTDA